MGPISVREKSAEGSGVRVSEGEARQAILFLEEVWDPEDQMLPCFVTEAATFEARRPIAVENFSSMVLLELLQSTAVSAPRLCDSLVGLLRETRTDAGLHHFFRDRARLPADVDCTAVAHLALWRAEALSAEQAAESARAILGNTDAAGIISVYFTDDADRRGLVDPVVCVNALRYLAEIDALEQARPTLNYVRDVFLSRAYEAGTRYYPSPDTFLCSLGRLILEGPGSLEAQFREPLRERIAERLDTPGTPLEVAQRVLGAGALDVLHDRARDVLLAQRRADGSWPASPFFRYGRTPRFFGSEALTTGFAVAGLCPARRARPFVPTWSTRAPRSDSITTAPEVPVEDNEATGRSS